MWCPTGLYTRSTSFYIVRYNDITYTSNILDIILFADDTTILYSHKDVNSKIDVVNKELYEVTNWFKANKLSVNATKTNLKILGTSYMTLTKTREDLKVSLDNTVLKRVKFTKFLGALIDECLMWTKSHRLHIKNDIKKYWCHEQT